jgi:hypothetical protein
LNKDIISLEEQLCDFCPDKRREALLALLDAVVKGDVVLEDPTGVLNLHAHTFYSYNGYGYSPTAFAWHARKRGLAVAGIVDFDVLDGVSEFHEACALVGMKSVAGMETRIYIPEFCDRVINSPGEPGISYHMGIGFPSSQVVDDALLQRLKAMAQERNQTILRRVNSLLAPAEVDYEGDALPLTPADNATERHLCEAYEAKACAVYPDDHERAAFWSEKLSLPVDDVRAALSDGPTMQGFIRAKTMKQGGVGYVQPHGEAFPSLQEVNDFVIAAGAIPTLTWLDGTSEGELAMDELLGLEMEAGVAAINIIPDRNWNIADGETKKRKVAELERIIAIAVERSLPVIVGTEMNAFGQKFVDDFDAPELVGHLPLFLESAHIVCAHTLLQRHHGQGYLSDWAADRFKSVGEKNAFFAELGARLAPGEIPEAQ